MDKWAMDGCKFLWHYDRAKAHFIDGVKVAPVHIDMGIAKFCQVSCKFCFGLFQGKSRDYIQKDVLLQTMRDAGEIGVKSIALIGDGEPTCNPAWEEALYVGKAAGLDMAMSSNTSAINSEKKAMAVLDNCTWMRVCIGAGTRDGYLKMHQKDYFDKVVENIRRLVDLKHKHKSECTLGFQTVFVPMFDPGETLKLAELAVDCGVDYCLVKQYSLPDEGQSGMALANLDDYNRPEVREELRAVENCTTEQTQCIVKWRVMARKGRRDYKGCPAVPLLSEMSGNGDWYPCGYQFGHPDHEQYKFGNVHEQSFKEIWQGEHYDKVLRKMRYEFDSEKQCKGCCRLDVNNSAVWAWLEARKHMRTLGLDPDYLDANIECEVDEQGEINHVNFI